MSWLFFHCGISNQWIVNLFENVLWVPVVAQHVKNPTVSVRMLKDLALLQAVVLSRIYSSDLALLWLWCRLAAAAPIRTLAWEPPYVMGAALEKMRKKKQYWFKIWIVLNSLVWIHIHSSLLFIIILWYHFSRLIRGQK